MGAFEYRQAGRPGCSSASSGCPASRAIEHTTGNENRKRQENAGSRYCARGSKQRRRVLQQSKSSQQSVGRTITRIDVLAGGRWWGANAKSGQFWVRIGFGIHGQHFRLLGLFFPAHPDEHFANCRLTDPKPSRDFAMGMPLSLEPVHRLSPGISPSCASRRIARIPGSRIGGDLTGSYLVPVLLVVVMLMVQSVGELSPVVTRSEGVFLVRLMGIEPSVQRSFESDRSQLEREELGRVQKQVETRLRFRLLEIGQIDR
jgi:hypothetical protein